jgi:hypothetical protein
MLSDSNQYVQLNQCENHIKFFVFTTKNQKSSVRQGGGDQATSAGSGAMFLFFG